MEFVRIRKNVVYPINDNWNSSSGIDKNGELFVLARDGDLMAGGSIVFYWN